MNLQIFKKNKRTKTHFTSSNVSKNLTAFENIEQFLFHNTVKTKQDFVGFTYSLSNPYSRISFGADVSSYRSIAFLFKHNRSKGRPVTGNGIVCLDKIKAFSSRKSRSYTAFYTERNVRKQMSRSSRQFLVESSSIGINQKFGYLFPEFLDESAKNNILETVWNNCLAWKTQFRVFFYNAMLEKNIGDFPLYTIFSTRQSSSTRARSSMNDNRFYRPSKKRRFLIKRKKWQRRFSKTKKNTRTQQQNFDNVRYNIRHQGKSFLKISRLLNSFSTTKSYSAALALSEFSESKGLSNFVFKNAKRNAFPQLFHKKIRQKVYAQINPSDSFLVPQKEKAFLHVNSILQNTGAHNKIQQNSIPLLTHKDRETFLSKITGVSLSLYRMNALSFTRFAFNNEFKESQFRSKNSSSKEGFKGKALVFQSKQLLSLSSQYSGLKGHSKIARFKKWEKKSLRFLEGIEKERTLRYRYTAIYIKDRIRVSFIGFYYKHAQLVREFFAFVLKKLPRNRKETKFIRFIIKLRKVFSAQRKEIVGFRVRFQGRINRWRRTKHIVGQKGMLPLHTFDTQIAYGRAQSIPRKGAFGRRLWIAYRAFFINSYKRNFFNYINGSNRTKFTRPRIETFVKK